MPEFLSALKVIIGIVVLLPQEVHEEMLRQHGLMPVQWVERSSKPEWYTPDAQKNIPLAQSVEKWTEAPRFRIGDYLTPPQTDAEAMRFVG